MFRVTGVYRTVDDGWFDFEYYEKHMQMCMERFGPGARRFEIAKSLPGETYVCIGTIYVDTLDVFYEAMKRHLPEISADVQNYTNIQPDILLEEVVTTGASGGGTADPGMGF